MKADKRHPMRRTGRLSMDRCRARFCRPKGVCVGLGPFGLSRWGRRTLTRNIPRISYRIQVFFWNPGGGSTSFVVQPPKFGCQVLVPSERRVEQEADGSWVTIRQACAKLESSWRPAATGFSISMSGQSLGRAYSTAWTKLSPFPETNFLEAAGSKPGLPVP